MGRCWWRYVSARDVTRLATASFAGSALGFLGLLFFTLDGFPRSVCVLDFVLCSGMTTAARLAVILLFEFSTCPTPE